MAKAFMIVAHETGPAANRVRKFDGKRYWTHPISVMNILVKHVPNVTVTQLIAALLHDVIEDTHFGYAIIKFLFGKEVADMVLHLTDVYTTEAFPNMNRKRRKEMETERLSTIPNAAKTVKLADFAHNSESIITALEAGEDGFAYMYMREKEAALPALRGGDPVLHAVCRKIVDDFYATHGKRR